MDIIGTKVVFCFQASYFVSIFPYILLTAMLVRGATLEGATEGIDFYINPDFSRLSDLKVGHGLFFLFSGVYAFGIYYHETPLHTPFPPIVSDTP